MSRLIRAERSLGTARLWVVAGTAGAIEYREDGYAAYVAAHSPVRRHNWGGHQVRKGDGIFGPGCYLLEGPCWMILVDEDVTPGILAAKSPWLILETLYGSVLGE